MFLVDDNGDIELVQGDSGQLVVVGLPTDKSYTVYFAIQNGKRQKIGSEIYVSSNSLDTVTFSITASLTDLLTVKSNEDYAEYYYGIKICDSDHNEDTLVINDGDIDSLNTITVYPKKVEGYNG